MSQDFLKQAARFKSRLEQAKDRLPERWYPYNIMASLGMFADLAARAECPVESLLGGGPIADIGCADGDLALFMASLGREVHAIDYSATNFNGLRGIEALRREFGSAVEVYNIDLDAQFALPVDRYSFIFFLGILYHLKNPYYALETLARSARRMLLSTRVARQAPGGAELAALPVAWLLDEREANNDPTNYWIFSEAGLRRILHRTGWNIAAYATIGETRHSNPVSSGADERAFCLLESRFAASLAPGVEVLAGWHPVEEGGWRWTERRFGVRVAEGRERVLRMGYAVPEALAAAVCPMTLTAIANGKALAPEPIRAAGGYVWQRRLPAGGPVEIAFTLDKAIPPGELDRRELGIIVTSLDLE